MARNLTEDEVKFIEERRKQQQEQSRRDEFEGGMSGGRLAQGQSARHGRRRTRLAQGPGRARCG